MTLIVVDVESDNQSPAIGSMVCFGAVVVKDMNKTFYGQTAPILESYSKEALAISGFSREEHKLFDEPKIVMQNFYDWIVEVSEYESNGDDNQRFATMISDNIAFDWQWINFYFHKYLGKNPFGFSGRRIGDLYCGMVNDASKNWQWKKKFRKTKHDHNPVNDAKGNAEAIHTMIDMGLKIKL